jgi:hypothetical protein
MAGRVTGLPLLDKQDMKGYSGLSRFRIRAFVHIALDVHILYEYRP